MKETNIRISFSSFISHHSSLPFKQRFTLIELLIVIAIISILAGMLLPALGNTKRVAQKAVCSSNMRQMGLYMQNYTNAYNYVTPAKIEGYCPTGEKWAWYYLVCMVNDLPGVGCKDWGGPRPVESTANPAVLHPAFVCPSGCFDKSSNTGQYYRGSSMTRQHVDDTRIYSYNKNKGVQITKVKHPSSKASYGDGERDASNVYASIPGLYGVSTYTGSLSHLTTVTDGTDMLSLFNKVDLYTGRHNKSSNFLHLDGHVENHTAAYLALRWDPNADKKVAKKDNLFRLTD